MAGLSARSLLPLVVALAGCAAFEGPQPSETEHTICYTRLETGEDQLAQLAKTACGGSEPRFLHEELDLSACPLLVPERAHFSCAAPPAP
jgi:hypothetical protein